MSNKFNAVIFDLDGVITKTALVHSAAWKKMFDEYLLQYAKKTGEKFVEFSHEKDYLPYVDGKPRYKGVESFLNSRGIHLPFGDPSDDPGKETVCGLGNRKNQAFNEVLDRDGVEVYDSTVELIHRLKTEGIHIGVASSSKNCKGVLEAAGLLDLFETRVDGVVSAEIGLHGKPEPDIFTIAADNLGVTYDKTVVVEDAVSGVQAGTKGNFGLVLGIAREENEKELKINGADIVVTDIAEIGFDGIVDWFENGLENDNWSISYSDYVPEKERTRETLLSAGNGYFGTRGALEETDASEFNYPGTYMAGLYNRLTSKVGDRNIENEDFVNCPNWLSIKVWVGGEVLDPNKAEIIRINRWLDFKTGILYRDMILKDSKGRQTRIESKRIASIADPHKAAISYKITPLDHNEKIKVQSAINGDIINDGVTRYHDLNQQHLKPGEEGADGNLSWLKVQTTQSAIDVAVAALIKLEENIATLNTTKSGKTISAFEFNGKKGKTFGFEKLVSIFSSQKWDSPDPLADAKNALNTNDSFESLVQESASTWEKIWDKTDIKIEGDRQAQKLLRMHLYHLIASLSPHNVKFDASITARGLHGEAYRGHIFWDELFILPLYNLHFPEVTKSTLMYRYRRLEAARAYAKEHGYNGAMFPWQSGSDGREETQVVHLNPLTGEWGADYSSFQRHVSLAVAYNTWQYVHATNDLEFLANFGGEMFLDICRFWASKAIKDDNSGRYSIKNVMGPDEFHEKYPGSKEGGLKDNTYTNIMVVWALDKAFEILEKLSLEQKAKVLDKLTLSIEELEVWKQIASGLNIVIKDDILAQYDGYFDLQELDWDYYREKYGNIYRMDRLLKAEGKSADDYKVAKQADTLQVFFNLNEDTVTGILDELGYSMPDDYLAKNLAYYLQRTSHGSTLSRVVHAQLANMIDDYKLSWELYSGALTSDYSDVQGGTTGEGIHAGVMAGTILIAIQSFAGVDVRSDIVKIDPSLPKHWRKISFNFQFKQVEYKLSVSTSQIEIEQKNEQGKEAEIEVRKIIKKLLPNKIYTFEI
ncbi:MAG: beta-phosphoglucomutase family hydrolase [Bacteroidales bacterium]|nr:beta-phosphoglucomutase family hydrolase [Bacteroidales bacterium]